jgi:hypothetical protein
MGAGTNPSTGNSISTNGVSPYVSIQGTWSLGSIARDRALDRAAEAYTAWNKSQSIGPIKLAEFLKTKVSNLSTANRMMVANSEDYLAKLLNEEKAVEGIDTSDAHRYLVELEIERITTDVQLDIANYTSRVAEKYLAVNFPIN